MPPIAFVCFFAPLGAGSLKTFDEARCVEVAREMVQTGMVHTLHWNHTRYLCKPPLASWVTVFQSSAVLAREGGLLLVEVRASGSPAVEAVP